MFVNIICVHFILYRFARLRYLSSLVLCLEMSDSRTCCYESFLSKFTIVTCVWKFIAVCRCEIMMTISAYR